MSKTGRKNKNYSAEFKICVIMYVYDMLFLGEGVTCNGISFNYRRERHDRNVSDI